MKRGGGDGASPEAKATPEHPASAPGLTALAYELLDAHADTIELRLASADALRWAVHLDYLRALYRAAERILAEAAP